MRNWESKSLGEVCQFINRGVSPAYVDNGGIAVLNQKCVRDHQVNLDLGRRHDLTAKKVAPDRLLRAGDVLVNSTGTGTLGRVAQLREDPLEPTTTDSHVTIVRPVKDLFHLEFFGYALIAIEGKIQEGGEGCGGQTELSRAKLAGEYRVSFPTDLKEQKRIVAILDEAFEGIAAAKANAEKNLQNARDLFESQLFALLTNNQATWPRKTLREVAIDFGRGKSKHRPRNDPKLYGDTYPFIQTGDVRRAEHLITEYTQGYSEAGLAQSKLWPRGTLCITIAANIAETGVLDFDACFPDSVIGVVVDESQASSKYLEYMLHTVKAELKAKGKGSAQDNINLETFQSERFPFPDIPTQTRLVRQLDELSTHTQRLQDVQVRKLAALEELKKSLLHQAFSGQLTSSKQVRIAQQAALQTTTPEFAANVISLAYVRHERERRERTFGHVKEQKLLQLVESVAGIDLGRRPIKAAAGPNDFPHMLKAEEWARTHNFFDVVKRDGGYDFKKLGAFDEHLSHARQALASYLPQLERVIDLLLPMDTEEAEVFATVHAAWNNLVIDGATVTDDAIVSAARDGWHPDKLKIPEQKFRTAIAKIRQKGFVPDGTAKYVGGQQSLQL